MTGQVPAITVEVLPAGYGDCLLVTCPVEGLPEQRAWRLLVDTGPDECWPALRQRLAKIPPQADGKRTIDLLVVSHIDHDHIGAARLLLEDRELNLEFGDVWFNAPSPQARPGHVGGVAEGRSLAKLLGSHDGRRRPWNVAFAGQHAVTDREGGWRPVALGEGLPHITLLSPDPKRLQALFKVWERELDRLRNGEHNEKIEPPRLGRPGELDIEALANKVTALDRAAPNGSSIAFLIEHQGASALLAADAFPHVLGPAIVNLATERRRQARQGPTVTAALKVDVLKLSHHGSRANTTLDLLKAVQADHYIVSTNGAIFRHPNDEALARVVAHGGARPTLWFNYDAATLGDRIERWLKSPNSAERDYRVELPALGQEGVIVQIARRSAPQGPSTDRPRRTRRGP